MKKLLTTSALMLALSVSSPLFAGPGRPDGPPPHVKEALAKLPQDKQDMIMNALKAGREDHKAMREKLTALHAEIKEILLAPTFDKSAFLAKQREIDALHSKAHATQDLRIANVAAKLTADERKQLVEILPDPSKRPAHPPRPPREEGEEKHGDDTPPM